MSYTFKFYGAPTVTAGDHCDFYAGFPATAAQLAGEAPPFAQTSVASDLTVTLSSAGSAEEIALVLSRKGAVYGRSNSLPVSRFSKTEQNAIYAYAVSQTLTANQVAAFVPEVPFTLDNITVTSVGAVLKTDKIVLSGGAKSDGWWFFDFTLTFSYTCGLAPITVPIWFNNNQAEYATINRLDFSVQGKNILQDILVLFAKGTIRSKLEDKLAKEVNAQIRDQLSQLDGQAATVSSVTIASSGVTVDVTLVSPDPLCPFPMKMSSSSGARVRPQAEVSRMRRIRDEALPATQRGRAYLDMLRAHRTEVWRLFRERPDLAQTCSEAVDRVVAEAGRSGMTELSASAESVAAARRAIEALSAAASPGLLRDLNALHARLSGKGAVTASEFLSD